MADSYLVIVWDQNLVVGIDFYMIIDNYWAFLYKKIIWGRSDLKVILIQNDLYIIKMSKMFLFSCLILLVMVDEQP